jgi:sugar phosphate isomerase/epimerase
MNLGSAVNVRVGLWLDDLRQPLREAVRTVGPWRVEALGLDAFGAEVNPRALGTTARRDLRAVLRSQGAALCALRADVGGRRLVDRERLDVNLARLRDAVQLAADVGAGHVQVPGGYVPAAGDAQEKTTHETVSEAARALAGFAEQSGVRIAWLAGAEPAGQLGAFLNAVDGAGWIDVDWNPGAFVQRGTDPLSTLEALGPRIGLVRAVDSYRGGGEAAFGQGDCRWGELLIGTSALPRPQPLALLAACTLEGARPEALKRAVEWLLELRANPLASGGRSGGTGR